MPPDPVFFTIFLIFAGAAILATLALYARQALIVVYILLGLLLGPSGTGLVKAPLVIEEIGEIGIMFLLFLLGLNLFPQKLIALLREAVLVTGASSAVFALLGAGLGLMFGFSLTESAIIGAALMFSSTIIGLKLLPTTVLHHQHTGEIIISILLLQDVLAIAVLLALQMNSKGAGAWLDMILLLLSLPGLIALAFLIERYILIKLIARFDNIQEYIFLLAIGWCLGIAQLAIWLGLSAEIGAFIAGVSLASSPIAAFIAESLKPLRDFFLIVFFFALGAGIDTHMLPEVLFPATVLALLALGVKPVVFQFLLQVSKEGVKRSQEVGVRLGQISEFSLLIAMLALDLSVIGPRAAYLIQISTIFTFIVSSYWIVLRYPTPIAISDALRRD